MNTKKHNSKGTIAIIGAGTMGRGIAQVFLQADFKVVLADIDNGILEKSVKKIKDIFSMLVERGKLSPEDRAIFLNNLSTSANLESSEDMMLVIEAVKEDFNLKKALLEKVEEAVGSSTVIASNTSSFSINRLASAMKKPERFIGLHFFNPAPLLRLVEVVAGKNTSEEIRKNMIALLESINMVPVTVKNSPGFIVNRLLIPFINNAVKLYSDDIASAEDMDKAMKLGAGHPMGPLELADHIGLDICLSIMESLYRDTGDEACRPADLLREKVSSGKLGKKSGEGFYIYG